MINKETKTLALNKSLPCLKIWSISGLVFFGNTLREHPQRMIPVFAVDMATIFVELCCNALGKAPNLSVSLSL
jgi:hypothetical protein